MFFKKKEKLEAINKKNICNFGIDIRKNNWYEVFSASLGKITATQYACSELVVKGQNWNIDFRTAIISFGIDNYPLQFIGTESTVSNSWLWGWDNVNNFPDKIIELANSTKDVGEEWSLDSLTTNTFELTDNFSGHNLSIVTCAISDDNICYYRCPHSNGAVFVAFSNIPNDVFLPIDIHRFMKITLECIDKFHIDHKIFIQSFLHQNNTPYRWENLSIIASFGQDLHIDFEQSGEFLRISNMKNL